MATNLLKEIVNRFDSSGEQNDAHEFLNFIFNSLNDEMLLIQTNLNINVTNTSTNKDDNTEGEWEEVKKGNKTMKTVNDISKFQTSFIIGETFQGIIKQNILEKGHSISKCQVEPFFILSFEIGGYSIEEIFTKYFSKQRIDGASDKAIQTFIEKIPDIFILHIKGFYYDKNTGSIAKINKQLTFPNTLIVKKHYFTPSNSNKDMHYDLIGIIVHKGTKATEGHYVCYCKDNKNKTWYYIDDKKVLCINEETLYAVRPYVLFYRKN